MNFEASFLSSVSSSVVCTYLLLLVQYSVVEFSTNNNKYVQTTLLETLDKNEASKFIKDYLKTNPTAEKAQGYCLKGKNKNIWIYENIVAVATHKP